MLIAIAPERVEQELKQSGAHPGGISIMRQKLAIYPVKVIAVRTPAANVIKQECLACGAECVTPAGVITCAQERCDIILLGTKQQYARLVAKLRLMPYFGLAEVAQELEAYLQPEALTTVLPDGRRLSYEQLQVMGIINATPDSFYADSRQGSVDAALAKAEEMLAAGASILDVGGESTRPGSAPVTAEEEEARVIPVVAALKQHYPQSIISIDTYRSTTARAAMVAGADIINDISAGLADADMLQVVQETQAAYILMHMRGNANNMQQQTQYANVVQEVALHLFARAALCEQKGIARTKLILDPGIGFAKDKQGNLELLQGLQALTGKGYPVLLAASRKRVIGETLGAIPAEERLAGTIALSCQAVYAGVQLIRIHDVRENCQAVRMLEAVLRCR